MPDQIGQTSVHSAIKAHTCDYCGYQISNGDKYEKRRLLESGEIYTWKNHPHCQAIAAHFNMFDDSADEGLTGEDFIESVWEIYRSYHPEATWDKGSTIPTAIQYCKELMEEQQRISDQRYAELKDGERMSFLYRTNHSLLGSWKHGKVLISESGKYFIPDDKSLTGKVLYPHNMTQLRKEASNA